MSKQLIRTKVRSDLRCSLVQLLIETSTDRRPQYLRRQERIQWKNSSRLSASKNAISKLNIHSFTTWLRLFYGLAPINKQKTISNSIKDMLTFVKHNIKQSNTLIFRGYNYNAPMAIILMMFKITMAWVSQFIQSVLVEKNYSRRWRRFRSAWLVSKRALGHFTGSMSLKNRDIK